MPRVNLDTCPVCRYDLRGLPARHQCPECGFAYDERTLVWQPHVRRRAYLWVPLCVTLVTGLLTRGHRLLRLHSVSATDLAVFVVCALGLVGTLAWLHHLRKGGTFVAVTRHGIHARNYLGSLFAPWTQIRRISRTLGIPAVYRHGKALGFELDGVFESRREVDEFRFEIARARQRDD